LLQHFRLVTIGIQQQFPLWRPWIGKLCGDGKDAQPALVDQRQRRQQPSLVLNQHRAKRSVAGELFQPKGQMLGLIGRIGGGAAQPKLVPGRGQSAQRRHGFNDNGADVRHAVPLVP
jgi:hypothetical protein